MNDFPHNIIYPFKLFLNYFIFFIISQKKFQRGNLITYRMISNIYFLCVMSLGNSVLCLVSILIYVNFFSAMEHQWIYFSRGYISKLY